MLQQLSQIEARPVLMLVLAALAVMGSPGPATISLTAVGASFGLQRTLPYFLGLVLGAGLVLCAVAAGLVSLLSSLPGLAPILFGLSAAYILYLAFRIATAPPPSRADSQAAVPSFAGGVLLAVANPKAYLAIGAVYAGTSLGLQPGAMETAAKTAILLVMIVLIHLAWLIAGASFARLLDRPRLSRVVNLAFAAVLVASMAVAAMH